MDFLERFKDIAWGSNTVYDYILALAIFIGLIVILKIFQVIILAHLKKIAMKTKTDLDDTLIDIFKSIKPPFYFFVAVYFAVKTLLLPDIATKVLFVLFVIALVYEIIRAFEKLIAYFIGKSLAKGSEDHKEHNQSVIKTLQLIVRIILWVFGLILILSNLGVDVTSLIAGLGIGGIAIALALQNVLSDLFSSFSIYMDKPFKVGDFIMVGTDGGTVERIGLKTTRIQTLQGEELVIGNQELTSARVQNFGVMEKRRVVFSLGVTYDTAQDKLEKIPEIIKNIIKQADLAEFDRCHFRTYADSSLNFEIVYYISSADYMTYMDTRHKVNLEIFQKFADNKIEFAYPTQTLYVNK